MGGSPGSMAAFAPTQAGTFDLPAIRREFDASGLVVLHDVIEPAAFEGLQTMVDVQCVRSVLEGAWPEDLATNERWQQGLPPASFTPGHGGADWPRTTPWLSPALIANPAVEAVVEALLGPGCRLTGLSGNTAMPGSGLQYLHVDTLALPTEPKTTHVVVNFSCGPYGPANGATELWQGSHNDPSWDSHRRADDMQLEQHCHEAVVARRAVARRIVAPARNPGVSGRHADHRLKPNVAVGQLAKPRAARQLLGRSRTAPDGQPIPGAPPRQLRAGTRRATAP